MVCVCSDDGGRGGARLGERPRVAELGLGLVHRRRVERAARRRRGHRHLLHRRDPRRIVVLDEPGLAARRRVTFLQATPLDVDGPSWKRTAGKRVTSRPAARRAQCFEA